MHLQQLPATASTAYQDVIDYNILKRKKKNKKPENLRKIHSSGSLKSLN